MVKPFLRLQKQNDNSPKSFYTLPIYVYTLLYHQTLLLCIFKVSRSYGGFKLKYVSLSGFFKSSHLCICNILILNYPIITN